MRYGLLSPEALVAAARERGVKRLVLVDNNNVSCVGEFVDRCREAGIQPILGIDFRGEDHRHLYYGIAHNDEGFRELTELLSAHSLTGKSVSAVAPCLEHASIIYSKRPKAIEHFRSNEYLGIRAFDVNLLPKSGLLKHRDKLVAIQPVAFIGGGEDWTTHRILRAVDRNALISKISAQDCARRSDKFVAPRDLYKAYAVYPFLLENAAKLLSRCAIELPGTAGGGFSARNNLCYFGSSEADDYALLTKLARAGCRARYGDKRSKVRERLEKELKVIRQQQFCAYFLIAWDLVRYAKSMHFQHVGRGSGANSIVAYALGITDVDPIELDLYFERFINAFRASPPDFDIDFSWRERDEVLDYLFKRYGKGRVGLLATYNTFKGKSCIREVGKVFGLPKAEIDQLVTHPQVKDELSQKVLIHAAKLQGMPNYLSIHAGGVLIGQRPLTYHTAFEGMPKGFPVVHMDMYHAEDMGFHKFDILSQRGLGHIREATEMVKAQRGLAVEVEDIRKLLTDEKVLDQLRSAQCIGCFYVESPAMRGLLSKLNCSNYRELVAASSIIRPGVAQSGMMKEYIRRHHAPHSFDYPHPVFREQLGETHGVMVYQEDVMRIAHHFAGLELDESDVLRRLMSGKKAKGDTLEKLHAKYLQNCRERGYEEALIHEVWRQIESFAGYSFCKAHSASFAVESFQSLYLKTYYPHEFMVAVINNGGGFYSTEFYFHEARMQGATILPPCANHSQWSTSLEGTVIYVGFQHLQGLERAGALALVEERLLGGPYEDLADVISRNDLSNTQLDILIRIGALRFTGKNKYELMWEKNALLGDRGSAQLTAAPRLFAATSEVTFQLPELVEGPFDQAFDELELLGFPLCSPYDLLQSPAQWAHETTLAERLVNLADERISILGYFVCRKPVRTKNNRMMQFGCWLDQAGQFFDTVHFPQVLERYPLRGRGIYRLSGRVSLEFGFPSLEVDRVELLPMREDGRYGG